MGDRSPDILEAPFCHPYLDVYHLCQTCTGLHRVLYTVTDRDNATRDRNPDAPGTIILPNGYCLL